MLLLLLLCSRTPNHVLRTWLLKTALINQLYLIPSSNFSKLRAHLHHLPSQKSYNYIQPT
jgi:hypothetical protein